MRPIHDEGLDGPPPVAVAADAEGDDLVHVVVAACVAGDDRRRCRPVRQQQAALVVDRSKAVPEGHAAFKVMQLHTPGAGDGVLPPLDGHRHQECRLEGGGEEARGDSQVPDPGVDELAEGAAADLQQSPERYGPSRYVAERRHRVHENVPSRPTDREHAPVLLPLTRTLLT